MSVLGDLSARSWVWPGHDQSNVAIVKSQPLPDGKVNLIACQYDSDASHSQMWLNGESQQESDAPVKLRSCAQAFIGSHSDLNISAYFFGNIYEIVIYDGTVDAESMKQLAAYFIHRYSIDPLHL
jgi:hypothetical protein